MSHSVIIYSTSSCHYCQVAKDFLRAENIPFTEYNVGLDPEKRAEMVALTNQIGVPVIVIDGKVMVGYDETKMRELLSMAPEATKEEAGSVWGKVKGMLGIE